MILAGLPPPTAPLVDPATGMVTQAWYGFLSARFAATANPASDALALSLFAVLAEPPDPIDLSGVDAALAMSLLTDPTDPIDVPGLERSLDAALMLALLADPADVPAPIAIDATAAVQAITALMRVGGTGVGAHRTLMFDPSGAVVHADPLDAGFLFAGISQQAGVAGSSVMVLQGGPMTEVTWAWTPGQPLFVGPNGTLTHAVPLAGVMQEVGIAYTATMVMVQPQTPITLH